VVTPLYGATGVVSLAVATVVLRRLARPSGGEPRTALGQLPPRARRPVAIAVAVGVPLMVLYVYGYALTHPLSLGDSNNGERIAREPGTLERFPLQLDNGGSAEITGLSIVRVEGSPALQFERAGVPVREIEWNRAEPPGPEDWPMRPLPQLEVPSGGPTSSVMVDVRQGPTCPPGIARLEAFWVRYTVLGMRHEQRLPAVDGPSVRCR
jgi:hypothetical protein